MSGEYRWYTLPLTVRDLPPDCDAVVVSSKLDLRDRLAAVGESGVIDEHTIRLRGMRSGGDRIDRPVQYTPEPNDPHDGSDPDPVGVAEWPAEAVPDSIAQSGTLTWLATPGGDRERRYRIEFGVPTAGTVSQVPYEPNNLRCFDADGAARRSPRFPKMELRPKQAMDGTIAVRHDGAPMTRYHRGPNADAAGPSTTSAMEPPRRPFLHPVRGPDGAELTELGKPHDPTGSHDHHYSLWVAHANVDGEDFWTESGGAIRHDGFRSLEDGPVFGRLIAENRWTIDDRALLAERRTITCYAPQESFHVIDLDLELRPAGAEPVELGETPFGFLGARVRQSMSVFDGGGEIRNADGDVNEHGAFREPSRWIDTAGPVGPDRWSGIALMDHPENPRHPTAWHCRNDGWMGASTTLGEPLTIAPEEPLRLRYRACLHHGDAVEGHVERRYRSFASDPTVDVGEIAARDADDRPDA